MRIEYWWMLALTGLVLSILFIGLARLFPRRTSVYGLAGIASILFGLAGLLWPGLSLIVLITLFVAFVITDGILHLMDMSRAMAERRPWWPQVLVGIVGVIDIGAAVFILGYPGVTATLLLYLIAFWAIIIGLLEIVASPTMARSLLLVVGIISVLLGFVLLGNPVAGALALVVVIGVFAIVRGILLLVYAFRAPEVSALTT